MTTIDRYVAGRFFFFYLASLLMLVSFFIAFDSTSNLINYKISGVSLTRYYSYSLPLLFYEMTPIAALIGAVFTISNMNRNNELIALFSSGMSLARISAPLLVIASLISLFSFYASDHIIPTFARKKSYVYYMEIIKKPGLFSTVKTDKIWYRSKNTLFNIKTMQAEKNAAQGLTLYYFDDEWNLIEMIYASSVTFANELWQLSNGTVTLFVEESGFPLTQSFKNKTIRVDEDTKDLQSADKQSEALTRYELKKFIEKNKSAGLNTVRYEVDYHVKFAYAFVAFVMAFLGIPFSVTQHRSGGVIRNVGACVGLAFLFWILYSSCLTLGKYAYLPPVVAAWLPNTVMLALTFWFLLRLKR